MIDKANAVRGDGPLDARRSRRSAREYPDIERDHAYIDAGLHVDGEEPRVVRRTVVTTNMFGDIITDLGAMIQGGMGVAASGNIHPGQVSMFEPIQGRRGPGRGCRRRAGAHHVTLAAAAPRFGRGWSPRTSAPQLFFPSDRYLVHTLPPRLLSGRAGSYGGSVNVASLPPGPFGPIGDVPPSGDL